MKRIGVITDIHGNLPALRAVLDLLDGLGCDEILHLGDAVDIGPDSRECLELLLSRSDVTCLLGNHDRDFVLRHAQTRYMSHVPTEHKMQVFSTLSEQMRQAVMSFPLSVTRICGGEKLLFCHYALRDEPFDWEQFPFMPLQKNPTAEIFDEIFHTDADAVFFGHKHEACDIVGKRLYVDVGSVACHPEYFAQAVVIDCDDDNWSYRRVQTPYDGETVRKRMHRNTVAGDQLYDYYYLHLNTK